MEKYTGQTTVHARNGDERVFKLRKKYAYPDGHTEVSAQWYKLINGDTFVTIKEIEVDKDLELRDEQLWREMNAAGSVEKKRTVYLFHGYAWHGYHSCEAGKHEHLGKSSFVWYKMTKTQEEDYKTAGFKV